jgi:hypothetical protein
MIPRTAGHLERLYRRGERCVLCRLRVKIRLGPLGLRFTVKEFYVHRAAAPLRHNTEQIIYLRGELLLDFEGPTGPRFRPA